jgi:hypothetical protein
MPLVTSTAAALAAAMRPGFCSPLVSLVEPLVPLVCVPCVPLVLFVTSAVGRSMLAVCRGLSRSFTSKPSKMGKIPRVAWKSLCTRCYVRNMKTTLRTRGLTNVEKVPCVHNILDDVS